MFRRLPQSGVRWGTEAEPPIPGHTRFPHCARRRGAGRVLEGAGRGPSWAGQEWLQVSRAGPVPAPCPSVCFLDVPSFPPRMRCSWRRPARAGTEPVLQGLQSPCLGPSVPSCLRGCVETLTLLEQSPGTGATAVGCAVVHEGRPASPSGQRATPRRGALTQPRGWAAAVPGALLLSKGDADSSLKVPPTSSVPWSAPLPPWCRRRTAAASDCWQTRCSGDSWPLVCFSSGPTLSLPFFTSCRCIYSRDGSDPGAATGRQAQETGEKAPSLGHLRELPARGDAGTVFRCGLCLPEQSIPRAGALSSGNARTRVC